MSKKSSNFASDLKMTTIVSKMRVVMETPKTNQDQSFLYLK